MDYSHLEAFHKITRLIEMKLIDKNIGSQLPASADLPQLPFFDYIFEIGDQVFPDTDTLIKDILVKLARKDGPDSASLKKNPPDIIASLHVSFTFIVRDLPSFVKVTGATGEYDLDHDLGTWLNHVIIATTRGIMFSEFRNTYVANSILPLINPEDLSNAVMKS